MYVTHPRPQGSEVFQRCKVASNRVRKGHRRCQEGSICRFLSWAAPGVTGLEGSGGVGGEAEWWLGNLDSTL